MYREEHSVKGAYVDSSIVGKVHMSIAKIHEASAPKKGDGKMSALTSAAQHMEDALRLFRKCVGWKHPLTANALGCLGKVS